MIGLVILGGVLVAFVALFASSGVISGALANRSIRKRAKALCAEGEQITIRPHATQDDSVHVTLSIRATTSTPVSYSRNEILAIEANDAFSQSLQKLNALGGVNIVSNHGSSLEVELTLSNQQDLKVYLDRAKDIARLFRGTIEKDVLCPECNVSLNKEKGMIHEHICGHCKGRFVPQEGVARYVIDRLNVDISTLKEQLNDAQQSCDCPFCKTQMGRVFINEVIADLCAGCGGMWFDKGELTQLSEGEVREI